MKIYYIYFVDGEYVLVHEDEYFIEKIKEAALAHGFVTIYDEERKKTITINTRNIQWIDY